MRTNLCFQSSQPSGRLSSEIRVAGIQRRTPIGPASLVEGWQPHLGNLRDKFSSLGASVLLFLGTSGETLDLALPFHPTSVGKKEVGRRDSQTTKRSEPSTFNYATQYQKQ